MTNTATYRGRLSAGISLDGNKRTKMAAGEEDKEQDRSHREAEIMEDVMEGRWLKQTLTGK